MAKKTINNQKDYEKAYQEWLVNKRKKDASKWAKENVADKSSQFAEDYVLPAAKIVGSFSPVGPVIGAMDAYNAYKQGDNTGAIIGAGLEAVPYIGKAGKNIVEHLPEITKAAYNALTDTKRLYYNKAPWTWKPNPDNYYRAGEGIEFLDDVKNTGKIRAVSAKDGISDGSGTILKAKIFPEADTYWAKGSPLDGIYGNQKYGNHIIEASNDIPFVKAVNQRTRQSGFWDNPDINYNNTHQKYGYVKPRASYDYDELGNIKPSIGKPLDYDTEQFNLLKPSKIFGYIKYATGGEMKKKINSQFTPTYVSGRPVYKYGGRMKYANGGPYVDDSYADINAQAYGQTGVGTTGETQGGGGLGTSGWMSIIESVQGIGDSIGTDVSTTQGKIGSVVSGTTDPLSAYKVFDTPGVSNTQKAASFLAPGYGNLLVDQNAKKEENMAKLAQNNKSIVSNLPGQSSYIPTFKMGGEITDRVSSFDTGGLHSENGGIPIGQNAIVERDEFMFTNKQGKKYIFTNKF